MSDYVLYLSLLVSVGVNVLLVVAPRTKTKVDDKVLQLLNQYGVPLVEYLEAHTKSRKNTAAEVRPKVRDNRTTK